MMHRRAIAAIVLFVSVSVSAAADQPSKAIHHTLLTFYWIIDESSSRYRGARDVALYDAQGHVIEQTTRRFRRELVREGTGWLRDGRTVTYDRKVGNEFRFRVTKTRYGRASTGCPLDPYRSVAVDPRVIRLGSAIFIPQLKGAKLPDGTVHDGMFVAVDRGHFRGHHVDVFVGAGARAARPFIERGYGSRSRVTVEITGEHVADCP